MFRLPLPADRSAALAFALGYVLLVLTAALPALAEETRYLTEIEDLPLMPGLTEVDGAGLAFDKPSGRIVEAYARGTVSAAAVRAFYRDSLPQLGWQAAGEDLYLRDGEQLELQVQPDAPSLTLRFVLRPQ